MPYLGVQTLKDAEIKRGSATGNGSTTAYAIGWTPPSEQSLFITINGVTQQDAAYTISGATLTFAAAPASADAIEWRGIQSSGTVITPADGTVAEAKLADEAVVTAKIADNAVTGAKLAMGSDAAGDILTYTGTDYVRLAKGTASQTLKMNSGASAVEWATVAAVDNTPAFLVGTANDTNITGITSDTFTKVAFNTEVYDSDSAYNNSTYRFTVPSGEGGTYIFYWDLEMVTSGDAQNTLLENNMVIYKNGSTAVQSAAGTFQFHRNATSRREVMAGTHTQVLSAADYLELYVKIVASGGGTGQLSFRSWFGGHKLLL